jgi:hypothetical protein
VMIIPGHRIMDHMKIVRLIISDFVADHSN